MGKRWIHRQGVIFEGRLLPPAGRAGPGASEEERRAVVRFSNTFGWPAPVPDWLGMAIKLSEPAGSELDLLLVSAVPGEGAWRKLRPSRDVLATSFTSKVRYQFGRTWRVVVAEPEDPRPCPLGDLSDPESVCPVTFRLSTREPAGARDEMGRLELAAGRCDDPALRFRPPADSSRLSTVRARLYGWSRRA